MNSMWVQGWTKVINLREPGVSGLERGFSGVLEKNAADDTT